MTSSLDHSRADGDTPAIRLFGLLETIAAAERFVSLQNLVDETGLPKATLHRMLAQLEAAGMLQREADGRHYSSGLRLRQMAETLLLNSTVHGARHTVLRRLVDEVGESCNITSLSGNEVMYLDRVETPAPLRFYLRPGSRVPVHCSASGKLFLAQMSVVSRRRLLAQAGLEKYTEHTRVDPAQLEDELRTVREQGYATDAEEFLPGLFCIAMLASRADGGRSNTGIAIQGPIMRFTRDKAVACLPALSRAVSALAAIDAEVMQDG